MKIDAVKNILENFESSVKLCTEPCSPEIYQVRAEAMIVSERAAMDALASVEPENDEEREELEALEWHFSYIESTYDRVIRQAREETGNEDW